MYKFVSPKGENVGEIKSEGQKLYIYGDIVGSMWKKWEHDETCPQDVVNEFAGFDKDKPVDVYINSGGGDVFGALAICSVIKRHCGETTAHIDGIAASAASVIACACDRVVMPEYAQLMIHRPWAAVRGNSDDLLKTCNMLNEAENSIVAIYKTKLAPDKDEAALRAALAAETWYTGNTAFELFNVEVETAEPVAAAISSFYDSYKQRPSEPKKNSKGKSNDNTSVMDVFRKILQ